MQSAALHPEGKVTGGPQGIRGRALFVLIVFLGASLALTAWAQPGNGRGYRDLQEITSPVVRQRAVALIDAINSPNAEQVSRFLKVHAAGAYRDKKPLEARVAEFKTAHWQMGNIELQGQRIWDQRQGPVYDLFAHNPSTGIWWWLTLAFADTNDDRLTFFRRMPTTAPDFASEPAFDSKALVAEVGQLVERSCDNDAFSGAVLVAKKERVLVSTACGMASKTFDVNNTVDTAYNLASVNKMFTALAVMQLVEEERVSLSATVDTYLDDGWLPEGVAGKVTVGQLLSHRAGLGSYHRSPAWYGSREAFARLADYKPVIREGKPVFEPGTGHRYSNSGYVVLGAIIEQVTGKDYYSVIRERIYKPAGMRQTASHFFDEIVSNTADGYVFAPDRKAGFRKAMLVGRARGDRGTPAGGGFSTAADMHKFGVALLSGEYVSEDTRDRMWTDYAGTGFKHGYGYGFERLTGRGETAVGHNGHAPGVSTSFKIYPESGFIMVVLANYSRTAIPVARRLYDLIARFQADS